MGEMADFYIEQHLARGWSPVGNGRRVYGPPLKCKHCGATNVYWQRTREGHRLHNTANLAPHDCLPAAEPDGFTDCST